MGSRTAPIVISMTGKATDTYMTATEAYVTTTASAVLYDVRTGHIYGLAEASHTTPHLASVWTQSRIIDEARLDNEKEAFSKLVDQFEITWKGVLKEYKNKKVDQVTQVPAPKGLGQRYVTK